MVLVLNQHQPDEREMSLVHKTDSYQCICLIVLIAIVYQFLPELNWFFVLVSALSVIRGITGILLFSFR